MIMIERIAATADNYNRAKNKTAYYHQLQGMILVLATMDVDIQLVLNEDKKIVKIISTIGSCRAERDV